MKSVEKIDKNKEENQSISSKIARKRTDMTVPTPPSDKVALKVGQVDLGRQSLSNTIEYANERASTAARSTISVPVGSRSQRSTHSHLNKLKVVAHEKRARHRQIKHREREEAVKDFKRTIDATESKPRAT